MSDEKDREPKKKRTARAAGEPTGEPAPGPEPAPDEPADPEGAGEIGSGAGSFKSILEAAATGTPSDLAEKIADFTRRIGDRADKAVRQWETMAKQWTDKLGTGAAGAAGAASEAAAKGQSEMGLIAEAIRREADRAAERAVRALKLPLASDVEQIGERLTHIEAAIGALKLEVAALRKVVEERLPR